MIDPEQLQGLLALAKLLGGSPETQAETALPQSHIMVGQKVIIRTYSAGCWFGVLTEKSSNEVILSTARRMHRWQTLDGISLSAIALHGTDHKNSKICEPVDSVWLEAVEIIPCSGKAIESLEGAPNVKAS